MKKSILCILDTSRFVCLGVRCRVGNKFVYICHSCLGNIYECVYRTFSLIPLTSDISYIFQYIISYLFDDSPFESLMFGTFLLQKFYLFVPFYVLF